MYCIAYNGGCYGNFVAFTLEWMQDNYPVDFRPFTERKNSHVGAIKHRYTIDEAMTNPVNGAGLHPKIEQSDKIIANIEKLLTVYDKVLLLYPALDDFLWNCNNKLTKIFHDTSIKFPVRDVEQAWFNANSCHFFDIDNWQSAETWVYREFLSFWLYDQHLAETGYKDISNYNNDRVVKIQINQLRDNFHSTFKKIAQEMEISNVRSDDDLSKLHSDWLENEPYLYKDRLIKEMVDAIINDVDTPMNECSIFDQADIQRRLRNAGYEIKCYGLNEWPSTTTQLRELVYKV